VYDAWLADAHHTAKGAAQNASQSRCGRGGITGERRAFFEHLIVTSGPNMEGWQQFVVHAETSAAMVGGLHD